MRATLFEAVSVMKDERETGKTTPDWLRAGRCLRGAWPWFPDHQPDTPRHLSEFYNASFSPSARRSSALAFSSGSHRDRALLRYDHEPRQLPSRH